MLLLPVLPFSQGRRSRGQNLEKRGQESQVLVRAPLPNGCWLLGLHLLLTY